MHLASVHHCLILRTDRNRNTACTHRADTCCNLMGCLLPPDSSCSGNVEQFILQYYPSPTTGALLAANNPVPSCLVAGVQPLLSIRITGQGYTDGELAVDEMLALCAGRPACFGRACQQHSNMLIDLCGSSPAPHDTRAAWEMDSSQLELRLEYVESADGMLRVRSRCGLWVSVTTNAALPSHAWLNVAPVQPNATLLTTGSTSQPALLYATVHLPTQDLQDVQIAGGCDFPQHDTQLHTVRPAAHQRLHPPRQRQERLLLLLRRREHRHAQNLCGQWRQPLQGFHVGKRTCWTCSAPACRLASRGLSGAFLSFFLVGACERFGLQTPAAPPQLQRRRRCCCIPAAPLLAGHSGALQRAEPHR